MLLYLIGRGGMAEFEELCTLNKNRKLLNIHETIYFAFFSCFQSKFILFSMMP